MNIKEVKTAIKIGDFVLRNDNTPNKINIEYLPNLGKDILEDDSARIYLIVVDGIIKKIGGSSSKGGIKATMSFYVNAMQGSPGRPRFIIHLLIEKELKTIDLFEIEPFTLVIVDWNLDLKLMEFVWDGSEGHLKNLPQEMHIWSSSTLFTEEMKELRRKWFSTWREKNPIDQESILKF